MTQHDVIQALLAAGWRWEKQGTAPMPCLVNRQSKRPRRQKRSKRGVYER